MFHPYNLHIHLPEISSENSLFFLLLEFCSKTFDKVYTRKYPSGTLKLDIQCSCILVCKASAEVFFNWIY